MSHATNITQLKTILDAISTNTLGSSFSYFETRPTKLPAGMILFGNQPEELFYDTNNNLVTYLYVIRSIFPEEESSGAMSKWASFLDALTAEFRKKTNSQFGGNALKVAVVGTEQSFSQEDYSVPAMIFDIQVEVKMLKSIT